MRLKQQIKHQWGETKSLKKENKINDKELLQNRQTKAEKTNQNDLVERNQEILTESNKTSKRECSRTMKVYLMGK